VRIAAKNADSTITLCNSAFGRAVLLFTEDVNVRAARGRLQIAPQRFETTRDVHTSLSGTLLFSLCCSKRNAVRFDSRCALMRHRHDFMARRAAMAKRRKAAKKTAKKKSKKKKL
jgi:environmental stress-induced protein Ves